MGLPRLPSHVPVRFVHQGHRPTRFEFRRLRSVPRRPSRRAAGARLGPRRVPLTRVGVAPRHVLLHVHGRRRRGTATSSIPTYGPALRIRYWVAPAPPQPPGTGDAAGVDEAKQPRSAVEGQRCEVLPLDSASLNGGNVPSTGGMSGGCRSSPERRATGKHTDGQHPEQGTAHQDSDDALEATGSARANAGGQERWGQSYLIFAVKVAFPPALDSDGSALRA